MKMRCFFTIFWILFIAACSPAATIVNGDFESEAAGTIAGWQVVGDQIAVKDANTLWNRESIIFNPGKCKTVRIFLGSRGPGTTWYDNVRVEESEFAALKIVNSSFEEGGEAITGWNCTGERSRDTNTWLRYPGQNLGSGASARLKGIEGKSAQIWQDINILGRDSASREFVLSFDSKSENLNSDPFTEIFAVQADGKLGEQIPYRPITSRFSTAKAFGKHLAQFSFSAPGEASLRQQISLTAAEQKRPWRINANLRTSVLKNGSVTLEVRTQSKLAALCKKVAKQDDHWQELGTNFIPEGDNVEIMIRVKADEAIVNLDNVTIDAADISPHPKELTWLSCEDNYPIDDKLTISLQDKADNVLDSAIRLFAESMKQTTGTTVLWDRSSRPDNPDVELTLLADDGKPCNPEAYSLEVRQSGIKINSRSSQGLLYGLLSLFELAQKKGDGKYAFLAVKIDDYPDLPLRAHYWSGKRPETDDEMLDRLARLRYNAVLLENLGYYNLNKSESQRKALDFFTKIRRLGMEPIPVLQCFGHAGAQLNIDPNIAEGTEVSGERLLLVGTKPSEFAHRNIIRTETSNIRIADETGARVFLEGRDYKISPNEMKRAGNHFTSNAAPFTIQRTQDSRIADGTVVLANYDYISKVDDRFGPAYCPNEPRVYRIMGEAIQNTIRTLHPKYIQIGHDEILQMGTDSRCRNSGRTNAENFAKEVWELYGIAKAEDPNVRLMIWDDMVNPYSNGYFANSFAIADAPKMRQIDQLLKDPTAPAVDLLPKDIILNVWFYGPTDPLTVGSRSLELFGNKGYTTTASPWANTVNARGWTIACKQARDKGVPCLGILQTAWLGEFGSLEEIAASSWRVPSLP